MFVLEQDSSLKDIIVESNRAKTGKTLGNWAK